MGMSVQGYRTPVCLKRYEGNLQPIRDRAKPFNSLPPQTVSQMERVNQEMEQYL